MCVIISILIPVAILNSESDHEWINENFVQIRMQTQGQRKFCSAQLFIQKIMKKEKVSYSYNTNKLYNYSYIL